MSLYSAQKEISGFESEYREPLTDVKQFIFNGMNGRDVYNLAAPVLVDGEMVLAARTEPRESHDSTVYLFHEKNGEWYPISDWRPQKLEDPFFFRINNKQLMGAVKTFLKDDGISLGWCTVVFDISDYKKPKEIFRGPTGMKDIRFVEYHDKRIGVFTRPQGGVAGRGTCGYLETDSLENLTADDLLKAKLISSPDKNSWEGINQVFIISDNKLGLLGHIAWMGVGDVRHYYATVAEFSRNTGEKTDWKIISQRSDFPDGPAKREDLTDVLFPGGIDLINDNEAILYVGLSDTEAWQCRLANPFGCRKEIVKL